MWHGVLHGLIPGEGVIQGVVMEVEGTPARGAAGDVVARETNAFYYGLGTPEAPRLLRHRQGVSPPEVLAGLAAQVGA